MKNLAKRIRKKYQKKNVKLLTDDSLENIIITEILRKELAKTGECSIVQTVSEKGITLYVCAELRIMFSHMRSAMKQVAGIVGIINNAWKIFNPKKLSENQKESLKNQIFYFQYEEV